MSERLIIDNFAGLKHVEIDLKKINVFIGPQATGKSVTAKLAYFFKTIAGEVLVASRGGVEVNIEREQIQRFDLYFPPEFRGDDGSLIRYECGEVSAEVRTNEAGEASGNTTTLLVSPFFHNLVRSLRQMLKTSDVDSETVGKNVLQFFDLVERLDLRGAYLDHRFIPAGRSFFANLQRVIFSLVSMRASLDPFIVQFGRHYEGLRQRWSGILADVAAGKEVSVPELHCRASDVVGGRYLFSDGDDFLLLGDGRKVRTTHSSSAQQEVLPLAMSLAMEAATPQANGTTFYVEEPEAHLYPLTQRAVVELMAEVFVLGKRVPQFIITTHSPYILTSFNNLMEAGKIAEELAGDEQALAKLHEIVPASRIISPSDVAAYYFDKGGAESIIDETGLIRADQIDFVSDDISIEFDKLLDVRGRR